MPLTQRSLGLGPLDNNTYLVTCVATRETAELRAETELVVKGCKLPGEPDVLPSPKLDSWSLGPLASSRR